MDDVPTRLKAGDQAYLVSAVLAHKLNRQMQMHQYPHAKKHHRKRAPLWRFERPGTVRCKLIQRAWQLTRPQGRLTLTMSTNPTVKAGLLHYSDALGQAT